MQSHDNTNKFFTSYVTWYLFGRDVDFEYLWNYVAIVQAIL